MLSQEFHTTCTCLFYQRATPEGSMGAVFWRRPFFLEYELSNGSSHGIFLRTERGSLGVFIFYRCHKLPQT